MSGGNEQRLLPESSPFFSRNDVSAGEVTVLTSLNKKGNVMANTMFKGMPDLQGFYRNLKISCHAILLLCLHRSSVSEVQAISMKC